MDYMYIFIIHEHQFPIGNHIYFFKCHKILLRKPEPKTLLHFLFIRVNLVALGKIKIKENQSGTRKKNVKGTYSFKSTMYPKTSPLLGKKKILKPSRLDRAHELLLQLWKSG